MITLVSAAGRQLIVISILCITSFSCSLQQQEQRNAENNITKRRIGVTEPGRSPQVGQHPLSNYHQVSFSNPFPSKGYPAKPRYSASVIYNTPAPLVLFTPAVLEQQDTKVRHIYLKPRPSSAPPISSSPKPTQRAKLNLPANVSRLEKNLEAQPFHSYSTFILPPQLQAPVVPTQYPIQHPPTAYYGYANVPTSTLAPQQTQQQKTHVYLDQKHPVLHYHYQTYPNSKPLLIHNSIPQHAPQAGPHPLQLQDDKAVNEEVNEEEQQENEDGKEEVEESENVRGNEEEEDECDRPAKHRQQHEEEEEDDGEERENLEEAEEDDEEVEEKENLQEEEGEDNRGNYGPQVFYPQGYRSYEDDEEEEKPQKKKQYRNEEAEDEEEEENKRHDVTVKPNFGFDYRRLADEYKSIQYPKPTRVHLPTFVTQKPALQKQIFQSPNAKPYPNALKGQQAPKPTKPLGANFNIRLPLPYPNNVRSQQQQQKIPNQDTNNPQQPGVAPVLYQRLRSYFTPAATKTTTTVNLQQH